MADQSPHPLLQPVIIREVMSYLPKDFEMLKTYRLVCKPWHDELLDKWRKRTKVYIGYEGQERSMGVASFLKAYRMKFLQLEEKPFRQFWSRLTPKKYVEPTENVWALREFWAICGSWLHVINFHNSQFHNYNLFRNVLLQLTPNLQHLELRQCLFIRDFRDYDFKVKASGQMALPRYKPSTVTQPNLKTLRIWVRSMEYNLGRFPLSMMTILSTFTQIEELRLEGFGNEYWTLEHLINAIKTIRLAHQNSVLNMKKLYLSQIDNAFTLDLVKMFCELKLPLEELGLPIHGMGATGLPQIMTKYSTLTKVGLWIKKWALSEMDLMGAMTTTFPATITKLSLYGNHTDEIKKFPHTKFVVVFQIPQYKPIYILDEKEVPSLPEDERNNTVSCELSYAPM